jgi:SAM-dependent methyltransferase
LRRGILNEFVSQITFPKEAKVLEIGCGTGAVTRFLAGLPDVSHAVGVDPSPVFIAKAKELAGSVQNLVSVASLPSSIEYIRTGKLRGLAVTSAIRAEALPDVPSVGEFVTGYEVSAWYGVGAPKGTPVDVIDKLNEEINAGLADRKLKARLADFGGTVFALSPADFGKFIADETEKWGQVVRAVNIKEGKASLPPWPTFHNAPLRKNRGHSAEPTRVVPQASSDGRCWAPVRHHDVNWGKAAYGVKAACGGHRQRTD